MAKTIAIVLAAGLSRRFGTTDKLLADLHGQPLAAHIAITLSEMDLFDRIAICRAASGPLAELFESRGFRVIANPDSAEGQASSLRLGVAAAEAAGAEAILVCLADMPFVSPDHLTGLLAIGQSSLAASIPDTGGSASPPAVFARQHFSTLLALTGDKGARDLLRQAPTLACPAVELSDFDTADSLSAASLASRSPAP